MRKAEFIGAVILAATSVQIIAAANANAQDGLMETLDLDKDGYITLKEATSNPILLESFSTIDSDEDGRLSLDELNLSKFGVTMSQNEQEQQPQIDTTDKISG